MVPKGLDFLKKENVFWLINQGRKEKKSFNIWNKLSFDKPRLFLRFGGPGGSPAGRWGQARPWPPGGSRGGGGAGGWRGAGAAPSCHPLPFPARLAATPGVFGSPGARPSPWHTWKDPGMSVLGAPRWS